MVEGREEGLAEAHLQAVERVERFVRDYESIGKEGGLPPIKDWNEWMAFVNERVVEGGANGEWINNLDFGRAMEHVFGFDQKIAAKLFEEKHYEVDRSGETEIKSYQEFAGRWLIKALTGFGAAGSFCDIVNLVVAMQTSYDPKWADMLASGAGSKENTTVSYIQEMAAMVAEAKNGRPGRLAAQWIPTHIELDLETDDTMAWLLLARVRQLLGMEPPHVLAQVPNQARMTPLIGWLKGGAKAQVFLDDDSRNGDVILDHAFPRFKSDDAGGLHRLI